MKMIEQHYSFAEAAETLSVSTDTIRRLVHRGAIAPVRVISPQVKRIPASALDRFLRARTV